MTREQTDVLIRNKELPPYLVEYYVPTEDEMKILSLLEMDSVRASLLESKWNVIVSSFFIFVSDYEEIKSLNFLDRVKHFENHLTWIKSNGFFDSMKSELLSSVLEILESGDAATPAFAQVVATRILASGHNESAYTWLLCNSNSSELVEQLLLQQNNETHINQWNLKLVTSSSVTEEGYFRFLEENLKPVTDDNMFFNSVSRVITSLQDTPNHLVSNRIIELIVSRGYGESLKGGGFRSFLKPVFDPEDVLTDVLFDGIVAIRYPQKAEA